MAEMEEEETEDDDEDDDIDDVADASVVDVEAGIDLTDAKLGSGLASAAKEGEIGEIGIVDACAVGCINS
jgi:hypothetical protein